MRPMYVTNWPKFASRTPFAFVDQCFRGRRPFVASNRQLPYPQSSHCTALKMSKAVSFLVDYVTKPRQKIREMQIPAQTFVAQPAVCPDRQQLLYDAVAVLGTAYEGLQDQEIQRAGKKIGGGVGQSHQAMMGTYRRAAGLSKGRPRS